MWWWLGAIGFVLALAGDTEYGAKVSLAGYLMLVGAVTAVVMGRVG
ncbi:MAG: hypothetical protein GY795_24620 [Desulfobacterales bacterium]|nr:hypothetical protein [Desulfobacterales bacterium]